MSVDSGGMDRKRRDFDRWVGRSDRENIPRQEDNN
jgi:hypothetical protein